MYVKTIVLVGMIMVFFSSELILLFSRRLYGKPDYLRYIMMGVLIFWCVFALGVGGFVERGYAAITLISMTVIEVLVRRRRKLEQAAQSLGV
jgi:hypothetical protein